MDTAETLIIILHFGSVEDTLECLSSLHRSLVSPFNVFVVNNGSDTQVEAILKANYPNVIYYDAGPETGFAAGNNIGLRFAIERGYRYSLLLNNDTVANGDFLQPLTDLLDLDPTIAMAGPAIYYYGNTNRLWSCGGWIRSWSGRIGSITNIGHPGADLADVDYLPGACILVRNDILKKIDLMSEVYFLCLEEADWAIRIKKAGYRIVACPRSTLLHKVGVSSRCSPELIYNALRNRFLFLSRHFPIPISSFLTLCVLANELRKQAGQRWLYWRAFKDHLRYKSVRRSHLDAVHAESSQSDSKENR
jgi:GT2 family glycosyltransferase